MIYTHPDPVSPVNYPKQPAPKLQRVSLHEGHLVVEDVEFAAFAQELLNKVAEECFGASNGVEVARRIKRMASGVEVAP